MGARSRGRGSCAGSATFPFPGFRAGLRVRRPAPSGRIPVQRRPPRLEPWAGHRHCRVRERFRGAARRALNALHSVLKERGAYLVGPWRATASTSTSCPRRSRRSLATAGLGPVCRNPFRSIVVRAVEIVYRLRRGAADHRGLRAAGAPRSVEPRAGVGFGCTEAPRGICCHRYGSMPTALIMTARSFRRRRKTSPASRPTSRLWRPSIGPAGRSSSGMLRADHPQLRPVHFLRDPLPEAYDPSDMSADEPRSAAGISLACRKPGPRRRRHWSARRPEAFGEFSG